MRTTVTTAPNGIIRPPSYRHVKADAWTFDTNLAHGQMTIFTATFKPFGLRYRIYFNDVNLEPCSILETVGFGREITDDSKVFDLADVAAGDLYEWLRDCGHALEFVETLDFEHRLGGFVVQLAASTKDHHSTN